MSTDNNKITLMIFTCEGREFLLGKTINSFKAACDYQFNKTILAIDGQFSIDVIDHIMPDIIIQNPKRKGYVNSIIQALKLIDTEYFFWLEDDWTFNKPLHFNTLFDSIRQHNNWVQIVYSKYGPLSADQKLIPVSTNLYKNPYDFSANPCLCRTSFIKEAFSALITAPKGDKFGEDGFENFRSRYFDENNALCIIHDPVDHQIISHEGYLESTPRNWHMTNSLEKKTEQHLLTMPKPQLWRKLLMALRLIVMLPELVVRQLVNDKVYELCFRILASVKYIKNGDK